ncbi:MAG: hypothetical protein ABIR66_00400 [Saprospiraceae bacterium]
MGILKKLIAYLTPSVRNQVAENGRIKKYGEINSELQLTVSDSSIGESSPIESVKEIEQGVEILDKRIHFLYKKSSIGKQILVHRSENSVLDHPEGLEPYEVAGRKRLATLAGINWFAGRYFAAVSVYGEYLRIYKLEEYHESEEKKWRLNLIHEFTDGITFPDAVAVCHERSLIAITHSMTQKKGVSLHRMDKQTFQPEVAFEHLRTENTGHGVHFSPDSHYLAFTTLDGPGTVEVYDLHYSPVKRVCLLSNMHPYLRPKDVCFTPDAKYVAIIYSEPLSPKFIKRKIVGKRLAIHRFDAESGVIEEESIAALDSATSLVSCFELASFKPDINPETYRLFITNQASDKVIEISFNPNKESLQIIGSHRADFSFPHGLDISADGKLLAVTNFGDDCLRIFELDQNNNTSIKDIRLHILLCGQMESDHEAVGDKSLLDLAHAFHDSGYRVSVLLPIEIIEYTDQLSKYADAVFQLTFDRIHPDLILDEEYVIQFETLIQAESIDIIHTNSLFGPEILIAAKKAGIRAVLNIRELLSEDNELAFVNIESVEDLVKVLAKDSDFIKANSISTD